LRILHKNFLIATTNTKHGCVASAGGDEGNGLGLGGGCAVHLRLFVVVALVVVVAADLVVVVVAFALQLKVYTFFIVLRAFLLLVWYFRFHMNNTFTRFFTICALRCFCRFFMNLYYFCT